MSAPDDRHEPRQCAAALARAFDFLGKRWNGILLGVLLDGPAGFAELKRAVPGISDSMLSERLAELTAAGLFERTVDPGPPVSVTYRLTPSGQALAPSFEAITAWAEENLLAERCSGRDGEAETCTEAAAQADASLAQTAAVVADR